MSVFWWVELNFFSLESNEVSSSESSLWVWYDFASLYIKAQGYVPALLENLHGMSCSGTCWLWGGAWFQRRYGGFWMSSYQLMFPGVRTSLVLDLSLLPLVFSLILTVASRLLHLYSTNDKTSRLMMKSFSTMRDTWKGAQSYTERRRGRREIDVTRTRRGGNHKGREQASH